MTFLDFSKHLFSGDIEPDLGHFGTQRNVVFLAPHGVIHTISVGWNVRDLLLLFLKAYELFLPSKHTSCFNMPSTKYLG